MHQNSYAKTRNAQRVVHPMFWHALPLYVKCLAVERRLAGRVGLSAGGAGVCASALFFCIGIRCSSHRGGTQEPDETPKRCGETGNVPTSFSRPSLPSREFAFPVFPSSKFKIGPRYFLISCAVAEWSVCQSATDDEHSPIHNSVVQHGCTCFRRPNGVAWSR